MEIIHICEQKCSFKGVLRYAIHTHQNDLVDYYLDNFEKELDEDPPNYKEVLKKFDDDQNPYKNIDYNNLKEVVMAMNWPLILPCLRKIVFIVENYEVSNSDLHSKDVTSLLQRSYKDLNLFKFLYAHKNPNFEFGNDNLQPFIYLLYGHHKSTVKFVIENANLSYDAFCRLSFLVFLNFPEKSSVIFDFLNKKGNEIFVDKIIEKIEPNILLMFLDQFNEDVIVNFIITFIKLFDDEKSLYTEFFITVTRLRLSARIINSILIRIKDFLDDKIVENLADRYIFFGINVNKDDLLK